LAIQGNSWLSICRRFEISGLCSSLNSTAACITAAVAATILLLLQLLLLLVVVVVLAGWHPLLADSTAYIHVAGYNC